MRLGRAVAGERGGMPWIVVYVVVKAPRERDEGRTRRPDHDSDEEG